MVNDRNCSQEVMYFLLGLPFYSCSRPFVSLKLSTDINDFIMVKPNSKTNKIEEVETNENKIFKKAELNQVDTRNCIIIHIFNYN